MAGTMHDVMRVATPLGRTPPMWLLRVARAVSWAGAAASLLLATTLVEPVWTDPPTTGWSMFGADTFRIAGGDPVGRIVAEASAWTGIAALVLLLVAGAYVDRWSRPPSSRIGYVVFGVMVGGLIVPVTLGRAAWPGRSIRFVPLAVVLATVLPMGVLGPIRVEFDSWSTLHGVLAGVGGALACAALAMPLGTIIRRLDPREAD